MQRMKKHRPRSKSTRTSTPVLCGSLKHSLSRSAAHAIASQGQIEESHKRMDDKTFQVLMHSHRAAQKQTKGLKTKALHT
jgi:hypothetical protein